MQKADRYAIEEIGIPSMVLMERAALQIVAALEEEGLDLTNVLVACGSGNNGGDGYAIARLLYIKGYQVSVYFVGNEAKRSVENASQKKIADYYHIPVKQKIENDEYSVIIEAVFGNGLSRNIEGKYFEAIEKLNQLNGYKVAVDIPSGIHDKTGQVMGTAFRADLTLAVAFVKLGQVLESAREYVGKLKVVDIGIYEDAISKNEKLTYCYEFTDFMKIFPKRNQNSHKGSYGKVLLIVGSQGMAGAAHLCALTAYKVGAGLVHIYTHEDNRVILQKTLPEAIISTYDAYDEEKLQELLDWASVVGIGCGLGLSETSEMLVKETIKRVATPCVVDADALNIIAKDTTILKDKKNLILTPHMKEMARLLSCEVKELQMNRMKYLHNFVEEYPITCVLKDARTLVACSGEHTFLNLTGNCSMSKGGSGDVLTGMIAGILGQRARLYDAACLGVYLHGTCGDYARENKGVYSVLAGDLIESISSILKQIEGVYR